MGDETVDPRSQADEGRSKRCVCLTPGLGVALAGGGGRGVAQIGVLKLLQDQGIRVEYVAGTSIGAVIGALYALAGRPDEVERRFLEFLRGEGHPAALPLLNRLQSFSGFRGAAEDGWNAGGGSDRSLTERVRRYWTLGRGLTQPSLLPEREVRAALNSLFGDKTFADTKIPLAVTAVDLISGRRLIFASGLLRDAVYASTALPGIVPPARYDGHQLIDGAFGEPVPVETCRLLGAGRVIAVDVLGPPKREVRTGTALEVVIRADEVARWMLEQEHLAKADVLLTPRVSAVDWADFSDPEGRIAEGERAARERLPEIRDALVRFSQTFVGGPIAPGDCREAAMSD